MNMENYIHKNLSRLSKNYYYEPKIRVKSSVKAKSLTKELKTNA